MGVGRFFGAVRVMLVGVVLAGSAGADPAGCAANPVVAGTRGTRRPWLAALCALAAAGVWAAPAQAITYAQTTLPFSGRSARPESRSTRRGTCSSPTTTPTSPPTRWWS